MQKILEQTRNAAGRAPKHSRREIVEVVAIAAIAACVGALGYAFVHRVLVAPPVNATDANRTGAAADRIQVNVLNATPEKDLARDAMEYLRRRGFDVVEIGNYSPAQHVSYVLDRTGNKRDAQKVAYALGIADSCVRVQIDSSLFLDASVVIGGDYRSLKPWE